MSLGNPMMLDWISALHRELPSHAIRSEVSDGESLLRKVEMGLLDAALVYQPTYGPGLQVEQLMEEKLIRVRRVDQPEPYIYIDWGEAFRRQHDAALPDCARPALSFNLGPWPCSSFSIRAAAVTSARAWCRRTWTAACSSGYRRRRSSPTRPSWCTHANATAKPCNRPSSSCASW